MKVKDERDTKIIPVEKNGEYVADIIGIGHEGEGVGRVDGFTLFIHGALPGEQVLVRVVKLKKQFGYGKLIKVLKVSPERVEAPCTIYKQCGGCQLQHLSYEGQLKYKRQMVVDSLERIGKLAVRHSGEERSQGQGVKLGEEGILVHPTIGMSDPWRYRNKAQVPIAQVDGNLVGGFYAQGSHRIIDMDTCLIQHENNDEVIRRVKSISREMGISAYDEATHKGLLRHVVVKIGVRTGEMMLVLVTNGETIPHVETLIMKIRHKIPNVKSICHNVNREKTNVIFGNRTSVLWGAEFIHDYIGDIKFEISARSFYQVNPIQTEVLYQKALDYAGLTGNEIVIDAYCGIGTISLFLAKNARHVYGVEIVGEAIADARRNAKLNDLRNVSFAVGKAEEIIPAWRADGIVPDVIVVDPPRKGCEPELLETMLEMRPKRIVYVSCNPATLARDLTRLVEGGYVVTEAQPVDMFPHTVHVEAVVLLVRNSNL
ncbi:23S rRNA (uracil(1939)-C(5))-methyltransferase RlmD [Paenibacillus psychroresistens]|uniref:23S rRNA (Uracil(1939)-C(5))-methyltransferase RlmD n=1 Tax=Paenibacillus psychroresistens TaxID=1778678 RepID=A0A6B8REJ8_9BACL|nr:23S rRNA (uracil(1939)-C(5))-methyltransferase RlmD [Paenibacillus psychroresistens]QGQ94154.1 23S rRNA (uracil(1939)-C(5))-methyltransferase RlmD [Paenibacillus psychroresistens]